MVESLGCAWITRIGQKQRLNVNGKVATLPHFYQSCSSYFFEAGAEHCRTFGGEERKKQVSGLDMV